MFGRRPDVPIKTDRRKLQRVHKGLPPLKNNVFPFFCPAAASPFPGLDYNVIVNYLLSVVNYKKSIENYVLTFWRGMD